MAKSLIKAVLNAMPLPSLMVDQTERIMAANPDACMLLGKHIVGRHFAAILRQPPVLDAIKASLQDRNPRIARHLKSDGAQDAAFEVTCRYVDNVGAADAEAVLVAFRDVTYMEQVDQMHRDFVANVSHELRTPLTALMGFIETIRGPARDDAEARDRFLAIMAGEAARMNRLISDLLSLSRVERDERIRPRGQVDLRTSLQSILRSMKPLSEQADVVITLSVPDDDVAVTGNADQLRQVFTNLIENAIKYGGTGGKVSIVVSTRERDPAVRAASARIQVIDHGPGIDPMHLPRLTERFYRGDAHRSRSPGGTGLGLAIVKHIINRHRGRLRIESDPGHGAVFTVILPRQARRPAASRTG